MDRVFSNRIFSPVRSVWAINPSKQNGVPKLTVQTEKTKVVRYLIYIWVQMCVWRGEGGEGGKGEDFMSNKLLNLAFCGNMIC